jgi:hypothetical protein
MSKLIKQIHDLIDIAIDKGLTNYMSRSQIDATVYSAIVDLIRPMMAEHPKTKRNRNYLLPFEKVATIVLTGGIGAIPLDFEHEIEFYLPDAGKTHITIVERAFWAQRRNDPVDPPTVTSPVGLVYNDTVKKIEVAPTTITSIRLAYFKTPVKPQYATSIVLGQEVYDDTATVDLEFSALVHDMIMEKALATLGLGLQNGMLVRQSQAPSIKELKA